jgi:hypothetical protein
MCPSCSAADRPATAASAALDRSYAARKWRRRKGKSTRRAASSIRPFTTDRASARDRGGITAFRCLALQAMSLLQLYIEKG